MRYAILAIVVFAMLVTVWMLFWASFIEPTDPIAPWVREKFPMLLAAELIGICLFGALSRKAP